MARTRAGMWMMLVGLLVAGIFGGGCKREHRYSQETPDDVIKSAVSMVKNNDTKKLSGLVYADTGEMRQMLDKLGELFGHMQQLSIAAKKRFPDELAKMQEAAAKKAAENPNGGVLAMLGGGGPGGGGGRGGPPDEGAFRDIINRLFADPYAWLETNATRLTTEKITDDQASVLLDGQPVIPVIGLPMRMEEDKWYVALPLNMPGVSDYMPRTKQQWSIIKSVLKVFDNAVVEMTDDVNQGRVGSLDRLADKAQEKLIFPGAIAFASYQREMDVRGRLDRRMKAYTSRQRDWVKARKEVAAKEKEGGSGAVVSDKLLKAMNKVAAVELEAAARKGTALGMDKMTDAQFEECVGGWLSKAGLNLKFDGDLSADAIDPAIVSWEKSRATQLAKK